MALQGRRRSTVAIDGRLARVYFVLLKSGKPLGVREVQRLAALGSPGAAKHYLDRLVELGFAEKSTGEYVAKVNNDSVMSVYVGLLGNVVPRLIPYAVFCTVLLTAFYLISKPPLEALIVAAIPTALLWLEGLRLVRLAKKVSWERQG